MYQVTTGLLTKRGVETDFIPLAEGEVFTYRMVRCKVVKLTKSGFWYRDSTVVMPFYNPLKYMTFAYYKSTPSYRHKYKVKHRQDMAWWAYLAK